MANRHVSAIKRNRQNEKRRERNQAIRNRLRSEVRKVREAVARQDLPASESELRVAIKEITKAATKGVLHRRAASRRVGRLTKHVDQLKNANSAG